MIVLKMGKWLLLMLLLSLSCQAQEHQAKPPQQKTWVYSYIKALPGQRANLKEFIEVNWFDMDSMAVQTGLFNAYQLLENIQQGDSIDWDFIVAVEYFTPGTFEDIQEEWKAIRSKHKKRLVDGKDFGELGRIVRSEKLIRHTYGP